MSRTVGYLDLARPFPTPPPLLPPMISTPLARPDLFPGHEARHGAAAAKGGVLPQRKNADFRGGEG